MPVTPPSGSVPQAFKAALLEMTQTAAGPIGLAVSGGGDSIAMMHLAARMVDPARLRIISIDHGLRSEAAAELALVARQAAVLGLPHHIARWTWDGKGNLQAAARAGRWDEIRFWAAMNNLSEIWLGHTVDDQIETVLMRLARGSGIDGLRAMYPVSHRDGLRLVRPLLGINRMALRDWLRQEGIIWCDDPSNDDPRFDRVRARQMFDQLETLGLTRKRLLQTIDHMQAAHLSLQKAARDFARQHVRQDAGDLIFAPPALALDKADTPRRVMAAGFGWVGNRGYRPRFAQLQNAVARASQGDTVTLGGCILTAESAGGARLTREAAATPQDRIAAPSSSIVQGAFWDGRWFLEGPLKPGLVIRALGDGLKDCPKWRETGMPRAALLASPSVWDGATLLAAPLAKLSQGWSARIVADFHTSAFAIED